MTALTWDQVGEKVYETGADHAVLYISGGVGVAWNGLISVSENTSGGESSEYHFDGNKYLDLVANEDFQATIVAFTYPDEFEQCDGTREILPGFLVGLQPRTRFGLSYRTKIGNDVDGIDYGYKLHLVYNALASSSDKTYSTLSETSDPSNFSWTINAVPEIVDGFKPSAHFIIDSRNISPENLQSLEDILYGNESNDPRLPTPFEIIGILSGSGPVITVQDNGDGTWVVIGPDELITMTSATTFQIDDINATVLNSDTYEISTTYS